MRNDILLQVTDISKSYKLYDDPKDRLREALHPFRRKYHKDFFALNHVSFELCRGESVGILGRNGSGKSTLLKIIAGVVTPTSGGIKVNGKVAALLELGAGFNPEMSGMDNIYLSGMIMGFTKKEVDAMVPYILKFADIGDFIYQPIKTYSSGMLVRLAFAVQTQVNPDILIVDEALAVGDALFQKRCFQKIHELIDGGTALLFVSHDYELVNTITNKAVFLSEGNVIVSGQTSDVVLAYRKYLHSLEHQYLESVTKDITNKTQLNSATVEKENEHPINISCADNERAYGDHDAVVIETVVLNEKKEPQHVFYPQDKMFIRIKFRMNKTLSHLNVGLRILNKERVKIYSWGTLNQDIVTFASINKKADTFWEKQFEAGKEYEVVFETTITIGENLYEIQTMLAEENDRYYGNNQRILQWKDDAAFFSVCIKRREYFFGGVSDMNMKALYE